MFDLSVVQLRIFSVSLEGQWDNIDDFVQVKRMLSQLGRLRDIQRVNAQEIGMVERERAKLQRYCRVRALPE